MVVTEEKEQVTYLNLNIFQQINCRRVDLSKNRTPAVNLVFSSVYAQIGIKVTIMVSINALAFAPLICS
jgi:hypothetical protein